ncbi:MAG: hypothetical protein HOC71_10490 [Candidatus Latescibacteria bacterium]|nr:hypothetical protein [Candidatus Latescibacterota bacterium]
MGLQNEPKPYPCTTWKMAIYKENGEVDCNKTKKKGNCRFNEKGQHCSYPGKILVEALEAINYPDAGFLYEKINTEKLSEIAGYIARYLDRYKEEHDDSYSSYDEIIETIEEGIDWLSKLSNYECELIPYY